MREIVEYLITDGASTAQLSANVYSAIKAGWQPLGGVSGESHLYQAMVKYAPEEPRVEPTIQAQEFMYYLSKLVEERKGKP